MEDNVLQCQSGYRVGVQVTDAPRYSEISFADGLRELQRLRSPNRPISVPERRRKPFSVEEVMGEVALVLGDAARFLAEDPRRAETALAVAQAAARSRDRARKEARVGKIGFEELGEFATGLAHWLIERADRGEYAESVRAAYRAAMGLSEEVDLGRDLRDFAGDCVTGAIDGDTYFQRLNKPHAGRRRPTPSTSPRRRRDKLTVDTAEAMLESMLADAGGDRLRGQPREVWEVFKRFAMLPVGGGNLERVDPAGDLLLFEWGVYPRSSRTGAKRIFLVDLVRQFSILDVGGEYDRTEQLRCSLSLRPSAALRELRSGTIWSGADRPAWFARVERSRGFAAIHRGARADEIRVTQEVA